jgi:subtilisin-like proprotein convertase family protein
MTLMVGPSTHLCILKTLLQRYILLVCLAGTAITAPAGLYSSWTGTQTIPDNDGSGLAYSFNLSDPLVSITDIAVTINLSGGYNGDLYAYLSHGDGFAVLLNRVGRTSTSDYGYTTPGFLVTLTGSATADIHNYQSLSPAYNGSGQLTGTWGADGRDVTPTVALNTSSRTATLAAFNGLNPNGDWTLYIRDVSPGGISTLNSWSVDVSAVPEPVNVALGVFAVVVLLVQGRRAWRLRRKA